MNTRTSMESNDTIYNQSIQEQDVSIMFAGHLLIVFYCLIFIFGLLGIENSESDRFPIDSIEFISRQLGCGLCCNSKEEISQCHELLRCEFGHCRSSVFDCFGALYDISWLGRHISIWQYRLQYLHLPRLCKYTNWTRLQMTQRLTYTSSPSRYFF